MTDGVLVVDKPPGMTSHDVVSRVRRLAHPRRVGHAGTLDPMATGVLVLGIGKATRLLHHLVGSDKSYTATIRLGQATVTDDAEGDVTSSASAVHLAEHDIRAAVEPLTGAIMQVPSAVSAIKVDGKRAYKRMREGEDVVLAARPVTVFRFDVAAVRPAGDGDCVDVEAEVDCSSGTYIRALARDLGAALGVGGHLVALRRTRVGGFGLNEARTLDELAAADPVPLLALPDAVQRTMPARRITDAEAQALSFGKSIPPGGIAGTYGAFAPDGSVVALLVDEADRARPVLVFTAAG